MGRKGGNRGTPSWYKGKKIYDDIDGSEHYERDPDMMKQRGLNVSRKNFDKLTDEEREASINKRR